MNKKAIFRADDFTDAMGTMFRRIQDESPSKMSGYTWTQILVLKHLEKQAMTAAELARAQNVTSQSMATAIAFLESKKLVCRKSHPTDGRRMNIYLTAKGVRFRNEIKLSNSNWLSRAYDKLSKEDQKVLAIATEVMNRMVENN